MIGAYILLIITGASVLLIASLVSVTFEQGLVGQPFNEELLGNMTANVTSFLADNVPISSGAGYNTIALGNVTSIASAAGATWTTTACGAAPCYVINDRVTGNVSFNMSQGGSGFTANDAIWINYSTNLVGPQAGYNTARTVGGNLRTAFVLLGIALIIIGAGGVIMELQSWNRM